MSIIHVKRSKIEEVMHLTFEEIESKKSPKGGFTKAQLAEWGVPWPPPQGWRAKLEGRTTTPIKEKDPYHYYNQWLKKQKEPLGILR